MTLAKIFRRRCAALLLPLLLAMPGGPALAAGAELTYGVWSGGTRVMNLSLTLEQGEGDYRIRLEAELVGAPAWFETYKLRAAAEGIWAEGAPQPARWRNEQRTDKKKVKWIELAFQDGQPAMTSDPPFSPNIRPALDAETLQGSRDPLSAILTLLSASQETGSCVGEAKVYDGRRRFDLAMQQRAAAPARLLVRFKGPVWTCAVQLTPVAGYRYDGEDKTEVSSSTLLHLAEVVPGLPPLPVRIDAATGYGGAEIFLLDVKSVP